MDLIGHKLGNYEIVEELGRGGMAVVYRAYQPSLNRYVAIKVLPPRLGFDQEFVERFQREALAAAKLRHSNIVVIHDVGHEQDTYYMVMELLEGRTLKELVQEEGALSVERATHIVEQIAAALDYAHQWGFVHRDVKPANIFVGKDDHVTLTDFGIAKAVSEAEQLTRTGMIIGTPEYMSPEQAEGVQIDYRTDLYALGVVLYQLLVGQVPFRGTTPHAILHAVIYEPPPTLRTMRPALPPSVEAVVLKAIDKQPDSRYQSGAELVLALKRAQADQPHYGAPPPKKRRLWDALGLKKPIVWIAAAIAVVMCGLVAVLALVVLDGGPDDTPVPPTTDVAIHTESAPSEGTSDALTATAAALLTASATVAADTPEPDTDTPEPTTDTPETPTDTAEPPTDTATPTATLTPTPTPTPCPFLPQGIFAALWQNYSDLLGCPIDPNPAVIQDAEQAFDYGAMFWRQDNDYAYVVYLTGPSAGTYQPFTDLWTEGDPEYSCVASPPPDRVQPKRGFGAVWCNLGAASAPIGWGLSEEGGFGPGYGDPMVHQFQHGFIFRDSDGTTRGLAYVFFRDSKTFVREAY